MELEPASEYAWQNLRRGQRPRATTGKRSVRLAVLLGIVCSLLLHVLLLLAFSDMTIGFFGGQKEEEPIAFRIPRVEIDQEAMRPRPVVDTPSKLSPETLPELVEEKDIDLTEIQQKIPDDREIAITPDVKKPENLGAESAVGLALDSLKLDNFESSLDTLANKMPRVPDLGPKLSENQPMVIAEMETDKEGGKTRDLLEKAARGNEGIGDKFSTLDELMGLGGGRITDITKPIYMPSDLLFDFNEDRLREGAKTSLMMLGLLIDRNPDTIFVIEGHTDTIGSDERNLDLSKRRALAVSNWLQQSLRIQPERMRIEGFGEGRPLVSGDGTIEQQQPNRRVEIRMLRPGGAAAPSNPAEPVKPSVLGNQHPSAPVRSAVPVPETGDVAAPAARVVAPAAREVAAPGVPVSPPAREVVEP